MSNDSSKTQENLTKSDLLKRFYEALAQRQFGRALELANTAGGFDSESEKIVLAVLQLKTGIEKNIG
jgi:hypothetical protein